jgi:hypothetical protein
LGFRACVRTLQFVVEAPAFMRGKERFSAPGKSLAFLMRFSAGGAFRSPCMNPISKVPREVVL